MKRLVRKASGLSLYHGTSLESFKEICLQGELIPQGTENVSDWVNYPDTQDNFEQKMFDYKSSIFFTDSVKIASSYGLRAAEKSNYKDVIVILEFNLPQDILLPDTNDCPECVDWEESLDISGQVRVLESISINSVSGVEIEVREGVIKTSMYDWENDFRDFVINNVEDNDRVDYYLNMV